MKVGDKVKINMPMNWDVARRVNSMTKKEYIMLAAVLRAAKFEAPVPPGADSTACTAQEDMRQWIITAIAKTLKADNPRFDIVKFMSACEHE